MFHLAVVLEKGDVVDCRLNAEHAAVLVVHLDRGAGEAVFDAGPLDASGKLRTDLLGQLRADLTAEKAGDLLCLLRKLRVRRGRQLQWLLQSRDRQIDRAA